MKKVAIGMAVMALCAGMAMAQAKKNTSHNKYYTQCKFDTKHTFTCNCSQYQGNHSVTGSCPTCNSCKEESKYKDNYTEEAKNDYLKRCDPWQ